MRHASLVALASMAMVAHAQPGTVLSHQKIRGTQGDGFKLVEFLFACAESLLGHL